MFSHTMGLGGVMACIELWRRSSVTIRASSSDFPFDFNFSRALVLVDSQPSVLFTFRSTQRSSLLQGISTALKKTSATQTVTAKVNTK